MKIVIVGAVACGTKTASKIRRLSKDPEIVLIDKTDIISYGACGLPYFLSDEIDRIEKLYSSRKGPRNKEYFENEKNIDRVLLNTEALSIDRNRKILTLKNL
ncbi:MAG: FAD-dependent oxidoreductase, partial [Candidatus Delongbacteria bacterium]